MKLIILVFIISLINTSYAETKGNGGGGPKILTMRTFQGIPEEGGDTSYYTNIPGMGKVKINTNPSGQDFIDQLTKSALLLVTMKDGREATWAKSSNEVIQTINFGLDGRLEYIELESGEAVAPSDIDSILIQQLIKDSRSNPSSDGWRGSQAWGVDPAAFNVPTSMPAGIPRF